TLIGFSTTANAQIHLKPEIGVTSSSFMQGKYWDEELGASQWKTGLRFGIMSTIVSKGAWQLETGLMYTNLGYRKSNSIIPSTGPNAGREVGQSQNRFQLH